MKSLILIKLGGSVITNKSRPFTARRNVIRSLAREIKEAKKELKDTDIIVGHGSGSFGHTIASKYKTQLGLINKDSLKGLCLTSETAVDINRIVLREFLRAGLNTFSFSPASIIYSDSDNLKDIFVEPLVWALELNLIPLLYGDVIFDNKKSFTIYSAEKTLDILAGILKKNYENVCVVQCGGTDGVYDKDGKIIPNITPKNFKEVKKWIGGSKTTDVTGGMIHKVRESLDLASKTGIKTSIINGTVRNRLRDALTGKKVVGTVVKRYSWEVLKSM